MKAGKYLRKMRKNKNLSQVQMGKIIGKRSKRICEWENDKYGIKLAEFLDIAKKLNVKNFNSLFKEEN